MEELHKTYGDKVEFLAIYVREAHPVDGWRMASNDRAGISIRQPLQLTDRLAVASKCSSTLEIGMPLLVDEIDDRVGHAYSGMPDRLYVIDREGRIAYKGGRGPFGFKAREMEQALVMLLLDQEAPTARTRHGFPILSNADTWKSLPAVDKGAGQPLPLWARVLAATLPNTTAAMLELDSIQRTRSPLNPQLRAKMRWVAARANRCAYSLAYARADLLRAGLDESGIRALEKGELQSLPAERAALTFAQKMTEAANTVTDAEVAQLMGQYGNNQVVAMVLLLAYANFQDRLLLTLGLTVEDGGPLAPLEIRFVKKPAGTKPAPGVARTLPSNGATSSATALVNDSEWLNLDFTHLQGEMEGQRARQSRILVPSWEEVRKNYPAASLPPRPVRIQWSLVCMGYQPELAAAWGACTRAFATEAKQDRVFEESLFWIVTRTLQCFY
jgi:alkylhydroperoxidase family enzyme